MANRRLKWNSLLRYVGLEFIPEAPKVLEVTDELLQSLSWLTIATRQDRRLVRGTEQGAILVAMAWSGLNSVEIDELYPQNGTPDSFTPSVEHSGVLISSSTQLVKISFVRKSGEAAENYYVPPNSYYFLPHSVYSVTATVVPTSGGTASYVGVVCLI